MTDSTKQPYDLSKLKLQRDDDKKSSSAGPPGGKKGALLMYIGGGIFLALAALFFFRTALKSVPEVEVTTVTMVSPSQANTMLSASGYVVAQRKAAIASKATGRIVSLSFREGDKVRKGEIIARIESEDVEAFLAQARADLNFAQAELQESQRSLDRSKQLLERQLISQAEFDAIQSRYDRVLASIAAREAAVRAAEVQVENTRIRAPFDGTVLTKNADVGEVVAPFAAGASSRVAVVTIADMNSLEVEADVSESNIERISVGQPCEITLDAYPDRRYRGIVDKIVPTADRAKATVLTKIRFEERDERVLPEMSAKVHFLSEATPKNVSTAPKLVVDNEVVVTRQNRKVAFVLGENEIVSMKDIAVGESVGSLTEIKSGLAAGNRVVLRPSEDLKSGDQVSIKQ